MEELAAKALEAEVIDQDFAEDLCDSADLEVALGMFYTYVIEKGDDPKALLIEWGFIEQTDTSGDEQLTNSENRLIGEGQGVSYADLMSQLQEGEVLVATWLRDPLNTPKARPVTDEHDHSSIAGKTEHGYYVELRWFASTTGSVNPIDYDMFD